MSAPAIEQAGDLLTRLSDLLAVPVEDVLPRLTALETVAQISFEAGLAYRADTITLTGTPS